MKTSNHIRALLTALLFAASCQATQITNTVSLSGVPFAIQCDQEWTNQDVLLKFTNTTASEGYPDGYCSFGIQPGFVWLYPSRLVLDMSRLGGVISRIEVVVTDQCGANCTKLFAYRGSERIAEVGNAAAGVGVLALDFGAVHPDTCAVSSFEAKVHRARIFMEQSSPPDLRITESGGSITLSWNSGADGYVLEWTTDLSGVNGWTSQTNGVGVEGSDFVHRPMLDAQPRFFRLHRFGP